MALDFSMEKVLVFRMCLLLISRNQPREKMKAIKKKKEKKRKRREKKRNRSRTPSSAQRRIQVSSQPVKTY